MISIDNLLFANAFLGLLLLAKYVLLREKEKEIRIVDFERFRDIVKFRIWINLLIDCGNSNKDQNIRLCNRNANRKLSPVFLRPSYEQRRCELIFVEWLRVAVPRNAPPINSASLAMHRMQCRTFATPRTNSCSSW